MGSFFAGIKAGTLSGVLYVGGLAAFNVVVLYALKPDVITIINQYNPASCPMVPNVNGSVEDCFSSLVAVDVPFRAFVAFFITLLYSGLLGMYYESFPGKNQAAKGIILGGVVGVNLVFFGYGGYVFDAESATITGAFLIVWTAVFGYFVGRLYKKYTRVVEFTSQDQSLLRILVDGRDRTGKSRTFATTSNHRIQAELAEDASFKEWAPSGGVSLEDPRSYETVMEVTGDGAIAGKVSKKY